MKCARRLKRKILRIKKKSESGWTAFREGLGKEGIDYKRGKIFFRGKGGGGSNDLGLRKKYQEPGEGVGGRRRRNQAERGGEKSFDGCVHFKGKWKRTKGGGGLQGENNQ